MNALLLGGARSGKSRMAESLVASLAAALGRGDARAGRRGALHHDLAALCDRIVPGVAGLPLTLKGEPWNPPT